MLTLWAVIEYLRTCIRCIVKCWLHKRTPIHNHQQPVRTIAKRKHHHSQHKPEWLRQEIICLKVRMPQAGCRTLADICNRRYSASRHITVGKTCVHNILQRHQYEIQILRRNLKHVQPKAVPRNHIWGIDLTGKTDTHKNLHALLGIIDHGSRALLHLQALHDKTSRTLIACISEVICIHGKPKIIRTDNEAIFTSKAFRIGLKQLGIRHQLTDPGCPWQNGRIERLFGTLKEKLDQWIITGIEQLNLDLGEFRYWYNHIRPHQNLDGRRPAEAWNDINPYIKPPKQEQWFEAWNGLLTGYQLRSSECT